MGAAFQRLEALLIAVVLALTAATVVAMMVLRPVAPAADAPTMPRPVTRGPTTARTTPTAVVVLAPPEALPRDASPMAIAPAWPTGGLATGLLALARACWPWLAAVVIGSLAIARLAIRRRVKPTLRISLSAAIPRGAPGQPATTFLRLLPRLNLPRLRRPHVNDCATRLVALARQPRRAPLPITLDLGSGPAAPLDLDALDADIVSADVPESPENANAPTMPAGLGLAALDSALDPTSHAPTRHAAIVIPECQIADGPASVPWTAEDRVLAVAGALAELWAIDNLSSRVVAIETASAAGSGQVTIVIDAFPDEESDLLDLPQRIGERWPGLHAAWRQEVLSVDVDVRGERPAAGGPLVIPLLTQGRGDRTISFFPLFSWRHLGLFGGGAPRSLHAILSSLLCNNAPSQLALAIVDRGEIAPLYRDLGHLAALPGAPADLLAALPGLIMRGARAGVRPLLLVVVEPDATQLAQLERIVRRLRTRPATPLYLVVVQQQIREAGRELYALLPGLITSDGRGRATLLPGQGDWPRCDEARLVGRGLRLEGRAIVLDEAQIAAQVRALAGRPAGLAPVLWDVPPNNAEASAAARAEVSDWALDDAQASVLAAPELSADGERHVYGAMQLRQAPDDAPIDMVPLSSRAARMRTARERADSAPALATLPKSFDGDSGLAEPPAIPAAPAPVPEPDNGWPIGPASLGRVALAELMARVVTAPSIVTGAPNQIGVTQNRLAELLKGHYPQAQSKDLARTLLVWFDLTGVVAAALPATRWRDPRPLTTTNLDEIATLLSAIPCPDRATVLAMMGEKDKR